MQPMLVFQVVLLERVYGHLGAFGPKQVKNPARGRVLALEAVMTINASVDQCPCPCGQSEFPALED
jgi:hypothetical protein